ncbi:MAG: HAMP domain-containing protein, partial [Candidatus Marinimicrobia bacterium]|nr:HAMP domain-containing protein [Candidatus Neomarinimicrobiota bacterium]
MSADLKKRGDDLFAQVTGLVSGLFAGLIVTFGVCVVVGGLLAFKISRSIIEPLLRAKGFAENMASGDLSRTLEVQGSDESAEMMQALSTMQRSLAGIVGQVRESAESIQVASAEVATGNMDLSQRTEQTASNLEEIAASMEELLATVRHSADAAVQASTLATDASSIAQRGRDAVDRVVGTMDGIALSSRRIADITSVI